MHHNGNGSWTELPGLRMDNSCSNWTSTTIDLGSAANFQAIFNNGSGAWDNNGGNNYTMSEGVHQVKNGSLVTGAGNPCDVDEPLPTENTATVYYKPNTSWSLVNIHYSPNGGAWTSVPGIAMDQSCSGWRKKDIALGTASGLNVTFNNGSAWDNDSGRNYSLGTGNSKVENGVISSGSPCAVESNDITAPSVPTALNSTNVTSSSATIAWTASTDNAGGSGMAGYDIYRNGVVIKTSHLDATGS
ncbi:carbohydrate binding domain-containing protein [Paenibacillus sp. FA6]|uniref:carbohydrate binding domain-containing protein n=1 Tax=Paenibacillus sp. FA6 TaxID=3413029 RepID=UPI003F654F1D